VQHFTYGQMILVQDYHDTMVVDPDGRGRGGGRGELARGLGNGHDHPGDLLPWLEDHRITAI
jgi:hypothetical protein